MAFEKIVPEWNAEGAEPPQSLKDSGFAAGYKPPADYFNWFWHGVSEALKELQGITSVENGGTGATTPSDARKNLSVNEKTFIYLSQIGLTEGSETIESIVNALPTYSSLVTNISAANARIYPTNYGLVRVTKIDNTRTFFEFFEKGTAAMFAGAYDSALSTPWRGWRKVSNNPISCSDMDLNNLKEAGTYFGYTGMTNAAANAISVIEVIPYSGDWVLQRQTLIEDGKMFYRCFRLGTTWSQWYSIHTTQHPPYSYGTTDLTAGSSSLETGKLHFVYE